MSQIERERLRGYVQTVLRRLTGTQIVIADHHHLLDDLSIDSVQSVEILVGVERESGRRLPPGAERLFADVVTVGELMAAFETAFAGGACLS